MKSMYASRSVPVLNTPAPNAACVDDSSSQNESLQRKADMAYGAVQRVVQRETGVVQRVDDFPIVQFVYRAPDNNDLKFEKGRIVFTEYNANLVSSGFTGCLMMAFKFKKTYECKKSPNGEKMVNDRESYIAHVYCSDDDNDTKQNLIQAEQNGYITIEALFKPNRTSDLKKIEKTKCSPALTGTLKKNEECWVAEVNGKIKDGGNRCIKKLDASALDKETDAVKAFIFASQGDAFGDALMMLYLMEKGKFDNEIFEIFLDVCSAGTLQRLYKENKFPSKKKKIFNFFLKACSYSELENLYENEIFPEKNEEIFNAFLKVCPVGRLKYLFEHSTYPKENEKIQKKLKKNGINL